MSRGKPIIAMLMLLTTLSSASQALGVAASTTAQAAADAGPTPEEMADEDFDPYKKPFIDRAHDGVFRAVWRSAMRMDQWFGSDASEAAYLQTSGSLAPALLWDEFDGFQPRLRFQVDVPLPQLNERFHAFIGRVNREEYVTESSPGSGAFARQYGPVEDDETLFGIRYRNPEQGGKFDADAGLRLRSPLDPFVKGSYNFMKGNSETVLFNFRETIFWQNSEKFGMTTRVDIEKVLRDMWLFRWTGAATFSERSEGVRGYTSLTMLRGLPNRRAFAAELFTKGELDSDVPLGDYGLKVAYRRSIARDWLVLESRLSLTFPKDEPWQTREANVGVGIGLEMFFGTDQFLARPVTF
jgi:hypothetical protein